MPALNQNFTRLESDSYVLEFTPTDGVISLATYAGWWGVSDTDTAAGSLLLKGWTNESNGSISLNGYNATGGCENTPSQGTLPLNGTGADVNVRIFTSENKIRILMDQSIQDLITPNGTYYHELVLMKVASNTAYQCISHVAASGFITVENSIFTNRTYR